MEISAGEPNTTSPKDALKSEQKNTLDKAKQTLQSVINLRTSQITEVSENIAGHPIQEIRDAAYCVATDLLKKNNSDDVLSKQIPEGVLMLQLGNIGNDNQKYPHSFIELKEKTKKPTGGLEYGAISALPLVDFDNGPITKFLIFKLAKDSHPTSLESLRENLNIHNYRLLLKSYKWMFANILDWEKPGMISPEEADSPFLPPTNI